MLRRLPILAAMLLLPLASSAQSTFDEPREEFVRARVTRIEERTDASSGVARTVQTVRLQVTDGAGAGSEFTTENDILPEREDLRLQEGDDVVARRLLKVDGSIEYQIAETYRLPAVLWLLVLFLALAVVLGRLTAARSVAGLGISIAILALYVVPAIAGGWNPMLISLSASFVIACTSLYLAHGFRKRTSVALLSTLTTLVLATAFALLSVRIAKLFGTGSEDAVFLQMGGMEQLNLRGLLLGGMIIGCLGVLDDITTAQTAVVDELRRANPSLSKGALLRAGMSIGREHIASLINTLALAYAGASLPLLLLFHTQGGPPLWFTLNSEFIAEEIVRTMVGSAALLVAVPISTWLAVQLLGKPDPHARGHAHIHMH